MISVPGDIWDDLVRGHMRRGGIKVVLTFAYDGRTITLDPAETTVSTVRQKIGMLPTGWTRSRCTVSHFDETGYWDPYNSAYFLSGMEWSQAFGNGGCTATITQELISRAGAVFDLPVMVGRVVTTEHQTPEVIEFVCEDELSWVGGSRTREQFYVDREFSLFGQADIFLQANAYGPGNRPPWMFDYQFTPTFQLLNGAGFEQQWFGIGSIGEGQSVLRGYNALLASQLAQPVWRETGTMGFVHLWPFTMGDLSEPKPEIPITITGDHADIGSLLRSDWPTRIAVRFQGTKGYVLDTAREATNAALEAEVNLGFVQGGRLAETALALIERQSSSLVEQLSIAGPGLPSVAQLGDYLTIDYHGSLKTFRVIDKRWTMNSTRLGMVEASNDLEYREATYANWESSDWTTTEWAL